MLAEATVWVDPGGMTGIAALYGSTQFTADEWPFQEAGNRLRYLCSHYQNRLQIGWERFIINADTHKKTVQPEAMEMIGVTRYLAQNWNCQILPPTMPADRNVATPAMLKKMGIWTPGKDDAQSATQHLVAHLLRTGDLPPMWR